MLPEQLRAALLGACSERPAAALERLGWDVKAVRWSYRSPTTSVIAACETAAAYERMIACTEAVGECALVAARQRLAFAVAFSTVHAASASASTSASAFASARASASTPASAPASASAPARASAFASATSLTSV